MLLKILLTIGLIYVVYIAFFKKPALKNEAPKQTKKEPKDELIDEMIQCAQCGTYISNDEAILSMGQSFCSKECVEKAL